MNIWIIGPGLSISPYKHLIEKLNDKTTMVVQKVFPHCISHLNLEPSYWTWFDPHGAVDGKRFLELNPNYPKIKTIIPSPLCRGEKDFHDSYPQGNSFLETKRDPNLNWNTYEEFLNNDQLDITWVESIIMAKLWFDKSPYREVKEYKPEWKELAKRLSEDIEFRFKEFDKTVIGTHYSSFEENTISRSVLPICHKMGFKRVFILGFDGLPGRFYAKENPFKPGKIWKTSPYVGRFDNLHKWIEWIPYTDMEVYSVVPCPIDGHIPSLSFERALEIDS